MPYIYIYLPILFSSKIYVYFTPIWQQATCTSIRGKKVKQPPYKPGEAWEFQEVEISRFYDIRHMKVVRLSSLRTGRLYPTGNIPDTHFC